MFLSLFAAEAADTIVIKGAAKPCRILMKTANLAGNFSYIERMIKNDLTHSLKFEVTLHDSDVAYMVDIHTQRKNTDTFVFQISIIDNTTKQIKHQESITYCPQQHSITHLAHTISNVIFEAIQGSKGHFLSKIAFIKKYKTSTIKTKIFISDYDGGNQKLLVESKEFILGLNFSQCGRYLVYRSLHPRKGQSIWIYDLKNNTNTNLSAILQNQLKRNLFGKNISALTFGPTADEILFARSFKGSTTLHSYNRTTGQLFALTSPQQYIIQTCPIKTSEGDALLFSADTLGHESIYYIKNNRLILLASNDVLDFSQPKICENIKGRNRIFFSGRGKGFSSIWYIDENLYNQKIDGEPTPIVTMKRPFFLEKPCPTKNGLYVIYLQQGLNYNGVMMIDIKGNQIINMEENQPILANLGANVVDITVH